MPYLTSVNFEFSRIFKNSLKSNCMSALPSGEHFLTLEYPSTKASMLYVIAKLHKRSMTLFGMSCNLKLSLKKKKKVNKKDFFFLFFFFLLFSSFFFFFLFSVFFFLFLFYPRLTSILFLNCLKLADRVCIIELKD